MSFTVTSNLVATSCYCAAQVLTGDMLLAAAFVSYAGPFTSKFRATLIKDWIKFLTDKGTPMTPGITDPLKVRYSMQVHFNTSGLIAASVGDLHHW